MIIPRDDATVRDGLPDDFAPLTPSTPADPAGGTPGLPEDFATVDPADDAPEWSILKSGAFVRRNQMEEEAEAGPSLQGIMDAYAAVYGPGGEKLRDVNDLLDAGLPESAKLDQDTVRKFIVQKNLQRMEGEDSPKVEMGGLFVNPASEDFRRFADLEKEIRELHAQAPAAGTWDRMKRAYADGSFQTRMGFLRAKIEQGAASDDERFAYAALNKLPTLHDESDPFSWRGIIPWAWDKTTAGAASIAPMLIDTVAAGAQGALTGATAGAAAGSLAWGVGAGAGAALGALAGASAYAFKAAYDLESGYALRELDAMEDRTGKVLDPDVKTGAAAFIGILNGTLELTGIGILARLTPGVRTIVSASMREGTTAAATRMFESGLMASVIDAGKEVLKGTAKETGVELAQEVVSITGEEIAKSLSNSFQGTVFAGQDTTDMGLRLAETGVNAFFSFLPITGIPVGASLTLNVGDKALASVAKRIGQTDMAKKHPAIMENMLAGLVDRGQLPERAFLPAASIQALFQGADGVVDSGAEDALLARLGVERDDYLTAIDTGAEIAIPAPKLARLAADARTAGLTGLLTYAPIEFEAEQAAKNAKPAQAPPGEGQEAQAGPVELSDEDRQSLTALFQDAVPDDRVSPFAERITQDFARAGYSQAQADVFARIIDANANVWARETGQDAAAYYGRYGYRVERTKFGNILNAVREKYYPNLAWPDFERRYQKDDAFHGEVNARSGETLTTLKTDQEIEAWAKEQKQAFTPETHNPLVAHIWGRVNPKLLTPAQRKELTSIYGPKLFSRTRRNANGADVNNGQGLDQLEMEEAVVNLLPQTYGSDTLYTYLVEQGQGMGAARAEWDAQVDAAAEQMRSDETEAMAIAADTGAFQGGDVWWQGGEASRPGQDEANIYNPIDRNAPPAEKAAQLKRLSDGNKPLIDWALKEIDAALGTESKSSYKTPEGILRKATRPSIKAQKPWFDVEHIRDSLRFKTVINSIEDIPRAVELLLQKLPGAEVVKVDTAKMLNPKEWGWRFAAFDLRMPNGQLVEYYLPLKEQEAAKKSGNHALFEKWRGATKEELKARWPEYDKDVRASYDRYQTAWDISLRRARLDESSARALWTQISASLESLTRSKLSLKSSAVGTSQAQTPSRNINGASSSPTNTRPVSGSLETNIGEPPSADEKITSPGKEVKYDRDDTGQPRGATVFNDAQATIHFFEAADVSTAGHEIYHVFRRVLEDMAMAESATPEVKDDWAMACAFVGAEVGQKWTTEQEEKWARAGETYLLEGRSPSLELAGAFQRLRKWLVKLYRAMRGKVKLTNDMRGVFDRMLAADEEIEYAKAAGMIRPLLDKAKAPAEYAVILRRTELSGEQAILERRLAEERREAKGWRKFAAQVAKDDERHRTVDALVAAGGIDPQGLEGLYDEETIKKVRRLRIGLLKEGGASAVDMAMAYEFDHVDAMIDFLASVPTKKAIRDQVMAQLKAEWDSTFDASAAMATEEAEYLKEYEHRVIAENTRGEVITADKLRAFVNEKVGALSLKRIDQDYANLAAAMRREGKAAAQAYRAGAVAERLKAAQAMAKHRRAFAEYKARQQAKDYIAKTLRLFRREVNSKTLPLEYRARIQEVLKAYGLGDLSKSPLKTEKGLAAWYAELQMANEPIFIEPHLLTGQAIKPWRDMALEELKDLDEAVRQIAHYGRTQNKLLKSARKANLDAAAKEILDHVSTFHKMDKQAVDIVPTLAERMRRPFRELDMWLVRPEFLLERLDGFEAMGTVWQYIFKPIQDANNEKARLWRQVGRGLKDIIDRYSATDRALMRTRRFRAPGINELVTKEVILSLALNWGNEGNRVAIREGYGWTDAQVQAALDASMNKDDWEVVQSIWDLMESFWPRIDAVHKVMTGAQLPKVAASEVVTPHGTFRGGYYPLALDPRLDWKAAQNQDAQAYSEKRETVLRAAKPRAGHRKARTGTKRKPMLHGGLTVILKHFETVLHDVTHSEAVRDVNRLLTHDDVRRAIEGAAGREGYVALTAWLQNVANPEKMVNSPFDKWLLRARRNASIVAMGLKITTAMVQPLGLVNSWSRVPAQWLMKGLAVYASNPWKARQFVFERSAEMEARIKNFDRDAHDSMAGLLPGSLDAKITGFSFWFIGFMDAQVAVPTWMAAYSQAMNEKKLSENEAIDYADQQVRMTQSSGWVKDLPRIMTGNQLRRLFTMFYSFMNTTWNLIQNRFGAARYGRINFVQFAASTVMMLVVPAVWQWLYDNRGNDDDPEAKDLFFEVGRTAGGMFPIVREMASFFVNPEFGFRLSPTQAAFEAPVNLVKELMRPAEDKDIRLDVLARVGADFLGYGFGLPTRQAFITVDGLFDLWNEETDDPLRLLFPKPWRK